MIALDLALIGVAGAAGALLRHVLTSQDDPRAAVRATAAINVAGGGLLGAGTVLLGGLPLVILGGGLLGGLTTFSTWMVQADAHPRPWVVVVVPLLLGVAAAAAGGFLATVLS